VNLDGDRLVSAGDYQLSVGGGQPQIGTALVKTAFRIEGNKGLLDAMRWAFAELVGRYFMDGRAAGKVTFRRTSPIAF
jgi:hypothetical protein